MPRLKPDPVYQRDWYLRNRESQLLKKLEYYRAHPNKNRSIPERDAWNGMKNRCFNPKNKKWHLYGGRGITVCKEWSESFEAFFQYVGPRPSPEHSLDRYPDMNGNYEPGNVRWATKKEQRRNCRAARFAEFNGLRKSIMDWAEQLDVSYDTLTWRLKQGMTMEDAIVNAPPFKRRQRVYKLAKPKDLKVAVSSHGLRAR